MGVFMFICKQDGGSWSAKQYAAKEEDNKDLTAEGSDLYTLGRKLVSLAIENSSGGGVTSFFSYTTPNAGVYEVKVGGGLVMAAAAGAAASGGGAAPAEEAKKEEKEEEKEESDDDMGFSLFD
ncbi:unnamed protein product [Closterium sp. NIES-64]|nr:unnamed protein product [Closterium sp. NIES-64]CAI5989443.1 unnamed protein product [Closterium sp. NIES-65]CAI5999215.1 unnamed protein product [Closterium sp. NIES-64]